MSGFPNTPVLDAFQRRDSHTLGNRYASATGYHSLAVFDRTAAAPVGTLCFNVWRIKYRANQQVWVRLAADDNIEALWLAVRLDAQDPADGYVCIVGVEAGVWKGRLYRWGSSTALYDPITLGVAALNAGDILGLDAQGERLTLWYWPVWGAPTVMGTWFDTGLLARGYIGIGAQGKLA